MNDATKRSIVRWIHIVVAIPILGYIYSPFEKLPDYAPATRFVFLPSNGPVGIVDVERPHRSTTLGEEIGLKNQESRTRKNPGFFTFSHQPRDS